MQISQVSQVLVAAIYLFMVKKSQEGLDQVQDLGLHRTPEAPEASVQQIRRLIPGDFSSFFYILPRVLAPKKRERRFSEGRAWILSSICKVLLSKVGSLTALHHPQRQRREGAPCHRR